MGDTPGKQLMEEIKNCQKTAQNLNEECESLLQKQMQTDSTDDSGHLVKQTPLANAISNDAIKKLKDIDLALKSIQQQLKHALEKYLATQSDLPISEDGSAIQSGDNQKKIAKITIDRQVKLFDINNNNKSQNEPKLTVQTLFNGTLPDDVYLHLMSVTGIQECLLSNRLVCSFWNELVLERCRSQKSLKVFENFNCLMDYGELLLKYEKTDDTSLILKSIGDDLLFEGLETDHNQLIASFNPKVILTREKKLEASKVLTVLFPRVDELVLCAEFHTLIDMEHLLEFYSEQLTSLTVTNFGPSMESLGSKLGALNFPLLKSLNTFLSSPEDEHLLTLLPQLESLTLPRSGITLEDLLRAGTQLRELSINVLDSVYSGPEFAFYNRPPINSKLRKFSINFARDVSQALEFISRNLISLECLKLYFGCHRDRYRFRHLHLVTPYLTSLQQLHSLTLEATISFFLLDDSQRAHIQPQPSVRQLKLLLSGNASLPMDLFSRTLFAAFPNVERVLIAFGDNYGGLDSDTFAAFEDIASQHPGIVQLFRSKNVSKFTKLPNIVSPLLGKHRQAVEEYIEEVEVFGVSILKLAAYLVTKDGEDGPNLKSILRPADRLTAMSNLLSLLESGAFAFTFGMIKTMVKHMVDCALAYCPSQVALFSVTCKCLLSLLDCRHVEFENPEYFFNLIKQLVVHYKRQQFKEEDLLLQIRKSEQELVQKMFDVSQ